MNRYRHPLLFVSLAAVVFSCISSNRKAVDELALQLALRDELTAAQEAVVWTLSDVGTVVSYWIKNDVTGVAVTAYRGDLVLPLNGALWHLETGDAEADHDFLVFRDLVSGDTVKIPLDEPEEEADAGDMDDAGALNDEHDADGCKLSRIQGAPRPLSSVGPYVVLEYSEKTVSCRDETILDNDRYIAVDLSAGESVDLLNEEETERLFERKDVRALRKDGDVSLEGTVPVYNSAFMLSFVHVFSATAMELMEDGQGRGLVSSLEVRDGAVPKRLENFYLPPDLVRAFGASVPTETLGGFVAINGDSDVIQNYLRAFIAPNTRGGSKKTP